MPVYLVRRSLPDVPEHALREATQRCRDTAEQLARTGHRIRYLGSTYVPGDGYCGCLYQASSADVVQLATEHAAVPYEEIVPATLLGGHPADRTDHLQGDQA